MSENKAVSGSVLVIVLFVLIAGWFAMQQAIWVDETTQLSGISLPPGEQLQWLMGRTSPDLGVPPDRMPPLSYWLGTLWAVIFGLTENSLRTLGIFAMVSGAPAIYLTGRQLGGPVAGLLFVAVLFSAPGLIIAAGEIRTYPIFFAVSCWALWAYTNAVFKPQTHRYLGLLIGLIILMSYAHYFGVVAGCCMFGGLFIHRLLRKQSIWPILISFGISAIAWIGLTPFIQAALSISGGVPDPVEATQGFVSTTAQFAVRLLADPVFLANTTALFLFLAGLVVLGFGALAHGARSHSTERSDLLALWIPGLLAVLGLSILNMVIDGFDVLTPSYSIWVVPFLLAALLFTLRAAQPVRILGTSASIGIIAANVMAVSTLLGNVSLYTHGPGEWLATEINTSSAETLIVHQEGDIWGQSYFPVFYLKGANPIQTIRLVDRTYGRIGLHEITPIVDFDAFQQDFENQFAVRTTTLTAIERAAIATGQETCTSLLAQKFTLDQPFRSYCGALAAALIDLP